MVGTKKMLFKLVEVTFKCYFVPDRISDLIQDYHKTLKMRKVSKGLISAWYNLEMGIITGCTIPATLLTLAMNLLIKTAEWLCTSPVTRSGLRQPQIRAYMDYKTMTTTSTIDAR